MLHLLKKFLKKFTMVGGDNTIQIGIFMVDTYPSADMIRNGFINQLSVRPDGYLYSFVNANALGDYKKLPLLAEELLTSNVKVILSIGPECATVLKKASESLRQEKPIIFVNVKDPVGLQLIKAFTRSETNVTGIMSFDYDYSERIEHLFHILPQTRKVLIVHAAYDRDDLQNIKLDCQEIEWLLKCRGIEAYVVGIHHKNDLAAIERAIDFFAPDIIFTLRDEPVMASMKNICEVAGKYTLPVFASDIGSIRHGATFACGGAEYSVGGEAAYRVKLIIDKKYKPQFLPIAMVKQPYLIRGSRYVMNAQGIKISKEAEAWIMSHGGLIGPDAILNELPFGHGQLFSPHNEK